MKSIFYSLIVLGLITVSGASHAASALRVARLAGYASVLNRNLTQVKTSASRMPASLAPGFNAYKYASLTTAAAGKRINNNPSLPKSIEKRNFTTFNDLLHGKDQLPDKVKSMISGGKHQWPYYDDPFRLNEWYATNPSDMQKLKVIDYCVQNFNSIKPNILKAVMAQDARACNVFTLHALKDPITIDRTLLQLMIKKNPQLAPSFVKAFFKHSSVPEDLYPVFKELIEVSDEACKELAVHVANRFELFSHGWERGFEDRVINGSWDNLVELIIKRCPDTAKLFAPQAAQFFNKTDSKILKNILQAYPESAQLFTLPAAKFFATTLPEILMQIMQTYPAAAQIFTPAAITHYKVTSIEVINEILRLNLQAVEAFTVAIPDLIKKMKDNLTNVKMMELLERIAKENTRAAQIIGREIIENHSEFKWEASLRPHKAESLILSIIKNHPQVHEMTLFVAQKLELLRRSRFGCLIMGNLVRHDPLAADTFLSCMTKCVDDTDMACLLLFIRTRPDVMHKAVALFPESYKKCFGWIYEQEEGQQLTQSQQHAQANILQIFEELISYFEDEKEEPLALEHINKIAEFIVSCHAKEKALAKKGYVTFWHGQRSDKFFPIALDTLLYSIRTGVQEKDFLLLHTQSNPIPSALKSVDMHLTDPEYYDLALSAKQKFLESQAGQREQILAFGRQKNSDRQKMLFLNDSLFGNISNGGSNSFPFYFMQNLSQDREKITINDVFDHNGFIYTDQEFQELRQLRAQYEDLSKYGTLYLIAIPKEHVAKSVMPVRTGGVKTSLAIGAQKVDDMAIIAAELTSSNNRLSATDSKEYVAVMSYDKHGLMNPQSGAKIIPNIIANDEQRFKVWQARWKNLQGRIKERIESEREKAMNEESSVDGLLL